MPLEFHLLGPVEVRREGKEVPLQGRRQRALLALFLLHANEVLSGERLIEALFAGSGDRATMRSRQESRVCAGSWATRCS